MRLFDLQASFYRVKMLHSNQCRDSPESVWFDCGIKPSSRSSSEQFKSSADIMSISLFVIDTLDKSSLYMTNTPTHTEWFHPPHVNLTVMWGASSHLSPTCVASVHPPALKKRPCDPAIPSALLSQLGHSQKLPPIAMTFLKFRFYPQRRTGADGWKRRQTAPECCQNARVKPPPAPLPLLSHSLWSLGPFGHETGGIMHPAIDGQIEQTYLLRSVIRGLVFCHNIAAWGQEITPDCFHFM